MKCEICCQTLEYQHVVDFVYFVHFCNENIPPNSFYPFSIITLTFWKQARCLYKGYIFCTLAWHGVKISKWRQQINRPITRKVDIFVTSFWCGLRQECSSENIIWFRHIHTYNADKTKPTCQMLSFYQTILWHWSRLSTPKVFTIKIELLLNLILISETLSFCLGHYAAMKFLPTLMFAVIDPVFISVLFYFQTPELASKNLPTPNKSTSRPNT